ncbi:MAG: tetratricopeptide repeat protein [Anaerolineales bacterium]
MTARNLPWGLLLLLVALGMPQLPQSLALNRLAILSAHKSLSGARPLLEIATSSLAPPQSNCRGSWFHGFIAQSQGDETARDEAWESAIQCASHYIVFLHKMHPENRALAELAVRKQPGAAEGWFWLAQFHIDKEPARAVELYRHGFTLDPHDGRRWKELGDLLVDNHPDAAIAAYLQSCFNGDPGQNGCWRAGQTAERKGELNRAIRYYRFSRWEGALQRAAALEAQLADSVP